MLDQIIIKVAIYTDGMGTYQARCMDCTWKASWRRKEAASVKDAKAHSHKEG